MRKFFKLTALTISMMLLVVCLTGPQVSAASRPEGWTEETHGKKATPNYSVVFPEDKVNRIDIIISPENFQRMENDVFKVFMMSNEDPIYVSATVKFNNHTWWHVGIRYKGQSTLTGAMMSMSHKYPFRLNFDKFEDDYPEIDNQRFYGFDELIFNNNWYDPSFLRDKLTSDIFRDAGIPAPRCAFYRVYVDTGNGPVYWGLYTVFEDPSDKMLEYQFENPNGNLYKGQWVSSCIKCGSTVFDSMYFSFLKCGFLCSKCLENDKGALKISEGAAKALNYIVHSKMSNLFSFEVSESVLDELGKVSQRYMKERLEKNYTKLDFIKTLDRIKC